MAFSDLFKSKETKAKERQALELEIRNKYAQEESEKNRIAREAIEAHEAAKHAERMASDIPWVETIPGTDEFTVVTERYRWNEAFVRSLQVKGHTGTSQAEIVKSWSDKERDDEANRIVEAEREKKRNGSEPWVEVIGENISDEGQIELALDWNPAFIHYLRKNGLRGATDEILVQTWLAGLDNDMTNSPEQYQ